MCLQLQQVGYFKRKSCIQRGDRNDRGRQWHPVWPEGSSNQCHDGWQERQAWRAGRRKEAINGSMTNLGTR